MSIDSAYTSTKQVASTFKKYDFTDVTNLDYGGGKYDDATDYLSSIGSTNLVYDPFNRTPKHNDDVIDKVIKNGVDTITCLNVLNVLRDQSERIATLSQISHLASCCVNTIGSFPTIYIQVYEGNRSGIPSINTTQLNWKANQYLSEINDLFSVISWSVTKRANIIKIDHVWN